MNIDAQLEKEVQHALVSLYDLKDASVSIQPTRKDFAGTHTILVFPYTKILKQKPEAIGAALGAFLKENARLVQDFNVVKGFLNIELSPDTWIEALGAAYSQAKFGLGAPKDDRVMVEFSSPNTNKPLHLGHLRNNFLGDSIARILEYNGYEVVRTNLVNDRGIHICKSMLAYEKFGNHETPAFADIKGDHLAGKYYVIFDQKLKEARAKIEQALAQGAKPEEELSPAAAQRYRELLLAKEKSGDSKKQKEIESEIQKVLQDDTELMREVKAMLQKWEAGDAETRSLWKLMNTWVYAGFQETYESIGIQFDKIYQESDTYLLGKDIIEEGLEKKQFYREKDGSVWIDLSGEKLDKKILLRSDGTSVYMTQDLGTADLKYQDYRMQKSIYVVGNEQDYHFKVLFKILEKLGRPYASGLYHLSYGMVDLPSGKMKSREGTVVDADDLVKDMIRIAREKTEELGKVDDFSEEELNTLYQQVALGALKYFLLKVDPKKRMLFNPEESVDFEGDAAPFIQYNYARISSVLRKADLGKEALELSSFKSYRSLKNSEIELLNLLLSFPKKIQEAGENYSPSSLAQYAHEIARAYGKFWGECRVLDAESPEARSFRLCLSALCARVLHRAMAGLGIDMPPRM